MTEETANQTLYVRRSTKSALQHLALYLPEGSHGKATQDDAIRFLMNRAGIDIMNTREMQMPVISKITKAVRDGECVALIVPEEDSATKAQIPPLCSRKGLTKAKCAGCQVREE